MGPGTTKPPPLAGTPWSPGNGAQGMKHRPILWSLQKPTHPPPEPMARPGQRHHDPDPFSDPVPQQTSSNPFNPNGLNYKWPELADID
ncbi:hypothetical protein ARMGADRAFT_1085427 [Armillaria gallica]|uniref:Uncharacterized protein n=1 Tax=Armillaria gallica TaxID=47427 RepID=A0A2H3CXJ8_ARMGA|nr:hypothetical protein ARMGADRAFT_1085427 [Armillaria gallica]